MMASNFMTTRREVCENCCKEIYTHQKILICSLCNIISHYKCGKQAFEYDQTVDQWFCFNCQTNKLVKYSPFNSVCYNKYNPDDPEAYAEIEKIKNCLKIGRAHV